MTNMKGMNDMFDTVQVGKKIAQLRKQKDMTQYDLADQLGISFQAVSNWERGNSMPDISKLPELASLFGVSVDEILGKSNPVVNCLAENCEVDSAACTEEELSEAAQVAKPSQLEVIVERNAERDDGNLDSIKPLLPFLDDSAVDALAERLFNEKKAYTALLPFMSDDKVDELAMRACTAENDWNYRPFCPFASEDCLLRMAHVLENAGQDIRALLPFMDEDDLAPFAFRAFERGGVNEVSRFLPFLNEDDVKKIAEKIIEKI